jgi:hypothetical protein
MLVCDAKAQREPRAAVGRPIFHSSSDAAFRSPHRARNVATLTTTAQLARAWHRMIANSMPIPYKKARS